MTTAAVAPLIETLADLVDRLGGAPLERIRFHPFPGTTAMHDLEEIDARKDRLCELVHGVLVEKAVGQTESFLAGEIFLALTLYVKANNLGYVTPGDGGVQLTPDLVRMPDVAFFNWDRCPNRQRPTEPHPSIVPNLAVEVLSKRNRLGEMAVQRQEYFDAGVELVWEFDPEARTVVVYTSPDASTTLTDADTLDGGTVLPGYVLRLTEIFRGLDRRG